MRQPPKKQISLRLNTRVVNELQRLADHLGKDRPDVVELSITHLSGTLRAGQPVYIEPPPDDPPDHKRSKHAA